MSGAVGGAGQRRIMVGNYVLSESAREAFVGSAMGVRKALVAEFAAVWHSGVDVMLTPTSPIVAPSIDTVAEGDPVDNYVTDVMTVPANLTGCPAVNVPVCLDSAGLPVGMQLMAPRCREDVLLRVALAVEADASFEALCVPPSVRHVDQADA